MKFLPRASARCCVALFAALLTPTVSADAGDTTLTNLISLVSQRLALAEPVAHWKWVNHRPVADTTREQALLADIDKRAHRAGVDPSFARAFFADQIEANTQVQNALFDSWRTSPPAGSPPDLASVVRPQLDRLTSQLIASLARVQPWRTAPDCPMRIARNLANWKSLTRYDSIRADALTQALQHVCESGGIGGMA